MKEGELVLIGYTGRAEGEIFDTTDEDVAKENSIDREDAELKPVPVLIGREYIIEGLEEKLYDMEVGDKQEVTVPAEKGYGKRSSDNIATYPEKEFQKQGVEVRPGEELMIGQRRGKVVSKGSGRVRIDFNHPLAGKELEYDLEVLEKVEDDKEIAEHIYGYRIGHGDIDIEDGTVKIPSTHSHGDHDHELPEEVRDMLREEIEEATSLDVEFV
ncbi:FKBP-type peptidyl-prolyl cis-trans isomerase [Candidatus Nanohalococcus occultus]|uniref:peptidylprolyl isomerase n=1 Tax=Candidatus Nanohalococcus occultus TaxID=2978047 RepID=A0ABY8CF81_9ARCH|nr:FKBP-type peptidyl-prolyl cis-trans isomerase 2 [Candidatus Nanohaloarchaeota archaeon SVXNc]